MGYRTPNALPSTIAAVATMVTTIVAMDRQLAEFMLEYEEKLPCNVDEEPLRKRKMKFSVLPGQLCLAMP